MNVHPVADLYPMLTEGELAELVADLKEHGLLNPLVKDKDGNLLDGRNRLIACELAGVEPRFITYDGDDPDGYVIAMNLRRDLTDGQRAMVAAKVANLANWGAKSAAARRFGVNRHRINEAALVLRYAPDLADQIRDGKAPLSPAYKEAQARKAADESIEVRLERLRARSPELADQVSAEALTLKAAETEIEQRDEAARKLRFATTMNLLQGIRLLEQPTSPEHLSETVALIDGALERKQDEVVSAARLRSVARFVEALACELEVHISK